MDSHGQLRQRAGLAAGDSLWDVPHASPFLPHLNKYLLSTCCVSVRDQGSGVSSRRADPAGALGVRYFSKRTVCTALRPPVWGPPVPLGQLAGAAGREPSLQGAVHGAQWWFPWEPGSTPPHLLLGVSAQLGAVPAL